MKTYLKIAAVSLAIATFVPASFARVAKSVQQIPTRPNIQHVSRRTLINQVISGRGFLLHRGTRGVTSSSAASSVSSSASSAMSSSATSSSSSSSSSASSK